MENTHIIDALAAHPTEPSNAPAATAVKGEANVQAHTVLDDSVHIRTIGVRHRADITKHLLSLDARDRYLRFGYNASDEQIERYVNGLNFVRDEMFGIFDRKLELVAMAHLAYSAHVNAPNDSAEFGVSVLGKARGLGYGSRLFARAVRCARIQGKSTLYIQALSENTAMLRIARKAGATVEREGSESEAYLMLPPATFDTRAGAFIEEHLAHIDYSYKSQMQSLRAWLRTLQAIRQTVQEGRHKPLS